MSLTSIRLTNFSVFPDLSLELSQGINIFIGENGTGKTHFLKAVYATCDMSQHNPSEHFGRYYSLKDGTELLGKEKKEPAIIQVTSSDTERQIRETHSWGMRESHPFLFVREGCAIKNGWPEYDLSYPAKPIKAVFLPAKDMLTHANGLPALAEKYRDFPFDKTLMDIITVANGLQVNQPPQLALAILPKLEKMIDGTVVIENREFYIQKHDGQAVNFSVEAEGFKKIGLLWKLLMNESITEGSVLIWDEPDANINPKAIPVIVDCLLELSRHGIQIFLGTHSYFLAKYFDVRQKAGDHISFHSFYYAKDGVACETNRKFLKLKHNSIMSVFDALVEEVYGISDNDE